MGSAIRFTEEHLALFAAASGDWNPLHMSAEYAARTSYGQQVAFGALGAVAALGHAGAIAGVQKITADYLRPIFPNVTYDIRRSEQRGNVLVRLFDGSLPVLALTIQPGLNVPETEAAAANAKFELTKALEHSWDDITPGMSASGSYRSDAAARKQLCESLNVSVPAALVDVFLWSSYVVGMQLPGPGGIVLPISRGVHRAGPAE